MSSENKRTFCSRIKASNVRTAQKLNKTRKSKNIMCFLKHRDVSGAVQLQFEAQHSLFIQPNWQLSSFICCVYRKASTTYLFVKPNNSFSIPHPFETGCVELHRSILSLYHLLCLQKLLWKLSLAVAEEQLQPVNLLLDLFKDLHINMF